MQPLRPVKGAWPIEAVDSPAANPQPRWTRRGPFKLPREAAAAPDTYCRIVPPLLWKLNGRKYERVPCFCQQRYVRSNFRFFGGVVVYLPPFAVIFDRGSEVHPHQRQHASMLMLLLRREMIHPVVNYLPL